MKMRAAAALAAVLLVGLTACTSEPQQNAPSSPAPEPSATSTPQAVPSAPAGGEDVSCGEPTVTVADATELQLALDQAQPGQTIGLLPGTYVGEFVATTSGTAEQPILLCGGADAVLDGGDIEGGYVLHLDGAQYWRLVGFTVRNGQKGVMADGTVGSVISGLTVTDIGDEGIHLRRFSTDNLVTGNTIRNTGLRKEKFGEGIYIGTAESNWCDLTGCEPDTSDRNAVIDNDIAGTTAECVDIKEGTSGGILQGNRFDGSSITGADSWVDVKGNGWLVDSNTGQNSPLDGFQTHEVVDGWGTDNIFRNNEAVVNGPGLGYSLKPSRDNVVECSNAAVEAGEGLSNVSCT
ncbi:right-handed parallel beta-helix repeat-containing protein [Naasia sp. SYSU D00057]|uniref:right-handed parallel beta-helix repeat-containing protein n=1 Tax=Naasia sp. SYSU D00057 TaxID=2817380 RepID=UPI001B30B566|nr:right-handed parallel beta-helix repeat-containing protein [Naasia sp. SYSU D00057]